MDEAKGTAGFWMGTPRTWFPAPLGPLQIDCNGDGRVMGRRWTQRAEWQNYKLFTT
jgi:hypothetical protein